MASSLNRAQLNDNEVDLETRLTSGHRQSLRLWLRMLACTVRIEDAIRARLRSEFDTTLPRFDLMAQLQRYPQGLRMGELSRRMMVTGGNITGITDQLEREDLVQRIPDETDRRVYCVKLTDKGRESFTRMAKAHEKWLDELLGGVSAEDKDQLIQLLSHLKQEVTAVTQTEQG